MSNPPTLPPDIFDDLVDLLHDEPELLKECCLASKSWVPRTRKYLFANITFLSAADLGSWKETFPDSANSPAYHTRTLVIRCTELVTVSDAEEGGWIRAFSGVANLEVTVNHTLWYGKASAISWAPFRRFAPTLKSLHVFPVTIPCPQLFDLVLSSPLLEDLYLRCKDESTDNGYGLRQPQAVEVTVDHTLWYCKASAIAWALFHRFAPTLKSLRVFPVTIPCPQLFDFVLSSPLLEDLYLRCKGESTGNGHGLRRPQAVDHPTSPPLTGTLGLDVIGGMENTVR